MRKKLLFLRISLPARSEGPLPVQNVQLRSPGRAATHGDRKLPPRIRKQLVQLRRRPRHARLPSKRELREGASNIGVLAARAPPLERAVARVCQEAGAHVVRNLRLGDMNLDVLVPDERRIEVVANGLPLSHGAQLAVDATIVSPVTGSGDVRPRVDTEPGRAVDAAERRKRRQTYPELERARRCGLVVVGVEVGGRFGADAARHARGADCRGRRKRRKRRTRNWEHGMLSCAVVEKQEARNMLLKFVPGRQAMAQKAAGPATPHYKQPLAMA